MDKNWNMRQIAHVESDFPSKFGIPRQSGLVKQLQARVVFEPEFRDANALRGLEDFSHIWLVWAFSANAGRWSPTVKPPRLGGNARMGVFATRSPFRPNPVGLSCVQLEKVALHTSQGPVLYISGADLMDGTPIWDIKPYVPYADCHPEATAGFTSQNPDYTLEVVFPAHLSALLPPAQAEALRGVLAQDPRPSYQNDPNRVYGFCFAGWEVRFTVCKHRLTVVSLELPEETYGRDCRKT